TVNGEDLALVSDHAFECPMCAPWENQVISLTGQYKGRVSVQHATREDQTVTVNVKGTLEEAKQAGLYHPNCGHTMRLFLPGITRQARPQHD
ncbi:phage minor capsid protein, partial [Aerococcus urinae]